MLNRYSLAILMCASSAVCASDARGSYCGAASQSAGQFVATASAADHPRILTAVERAAVSREVAAHGWPTIAVLGRNRVDELVRVIAMQPVDPPFAESITNAMARCAGVEIDRDVFADLNDRLEMKMGRPQQFGTQYELRHGKPVLRLPVDRAIMRVLRGQFAMPSIAAQTATITARMRAGASIEQARGLPKRATLPPLTQPALRLQLLACKDEDQAAREAWIRTGAMHADSPQARAVEAIDQRHTQRIKRLWTDHPIPGADAIGIDGVNAAFLLIQHATDTAWAIGQGAHMRTLLSGGSLSLSDYALYEDRIHVKLHQPQRFGSQFHTGPDGRLMPYPIEDPANVDARRAAMNLQPLAEYRRQLQGPRQ